MASLVQFIVDDTSPAVEYAPFADTLTLPDLAAGWNPYFLGSGFVSSVGQTGVGQSQHITAHNGASVTLNWHGTSIQLFGNTTASASFNLTLDGNAIQPNQTNVTHNLLTSLDGLPNTNHSITLITNTPDSQDPPDSSLVVFDKAVITSPPPDDFSQIIFTEHVVDDDDIDFEGQWTFLPSTGLPPFAQSTTQSDTAKVTFSGISVLIFGTTAPAAGNYSVLLDGTQSPIFSAMSSFTNTGTLLFFASGLAPNVSHQITIRNEGGTLALKSGGFTIFSSGEPTALPPPGNPASSPNPTSPPPPPPSAATSNRFTRGTIAALVLAGFLAFVLLTAVLFFFCIWRPRRRRRRQNRHDLDFTFVQPSERSAHSRKPVSRAYRHSPYPHEKSQEHDPAAIAVSAGGPGAVLDIGHARRDGTGGDLHGDTINLTPNRASPISITSPTNGGAGGGRGYRDSGKSGFSGFARWKRDINTLSGLTSLGINFRHSDEKSPSGDNGRNGDYANGENDARGFIYGTYDPRVDGVIHDVVGGPNEGDERIKSTSTQSSSRSFGRFGRKRSSNNQSRSGNGNGKGKGRLSSRFGSVSFPFRLSAISRRGESSTHRDRQDDESLSGFTSLSYASNPNIAAYLDIQPPSYAASVSQHSVSGSNASSPLSVPRSVTRSPQSQSRNLSMPPSPQDIHGPSPLGDFPPVLTVEDPSPLRDDEAGSTGMYILGVSGGSSSVGRPISMRAAIRGLSPRISKTRSGERRRSRAKGKEKARETEQKHSNGEEPTQRRQRQLPVPPRESTPPDPSRSNIAISGHEQQASGSIDETTPRPPLAPPPAVLVSQAANHTGRGSPIRALPPIPFTPSTPSTPQPLPQPPTQQKSQPPRPQPKPPHGHSTSTASVPPSSYLSIPAPSPLKLNFDQSQGSGTPGPPSSSSSSSNNERRFKPRSSLGDAGGVGSPGAVQSFAEAAAIAATPSTQRSSTGGILVEGGPTGAGSGDTAGERGEETRRLSTASRVHFEDDPSSTSASATNLADDKGEVKAQEEKEMKSRFRLTPPSGQTPPSAIAGTEISPAPTDANLPSSDASRSPEFVGRSSFLDFSSQPSSPYSRHASEATGLERSLSIGTTDNSHEPGSGRIWSMHLPGRNIVDTSGDALKSKWSNTTLNTTMQTAHSDSSSSNSGYGSPPTQPASIPTTEEGPRRSLFPFPLTIPPSPHMPEGFAGVEASPSLLSPTTSVPATTPIQRNEFRRHPRLQTTLVGPRGTGTSRHPHVPDNTNDGNDQHHETSNNEAPGDSPTDSFPYSISEIHFRTSVGNESDLDVEPARVQSPPQPTTSSHPPLPSTQLRLSPQRFNPQQEQSQQQQNSGS